MSDDVYAPEKNSSETQCLNEDLLLSIIPGMISKHICKTISEKNHRKFIQECVSTYPSASEIAKYCWDTSYSKLLDGGVLFQTICTTPGAIYIEHLEMHQQRCGIKINTKIDTLFHTFAFGNGHNSIGGPFDSRRSIGYGFCCKVFGQESEEEQFNQAGVVVAESCFWDCCIEMDKVNSKIQHLTEQMRFLKFYDKSPDRSQGKVREFSTRLDLLSVYKIMCNRLSCLHDNSERLAAIALIKQFLIAEVDSMLAREINFMQLSCELYNNICMFNRAMYHPEYTILTLQKSPSLRTQVIVEIKQSIMAL